MRLTVIWGTAGVHVDVVGSLGRGWPTRNGSKRGGKEGVNKDINTVEL